jgi:hypothetical protein
LVPAFDGGNDLVGVGGPGEGFGFLVVLGEEAVDCRLEVDDGVEDASLETTFDGATAPAGCQLIGRWRIVEADMI